MNVRLTAVVLFLAAVAGLPLFADDEFQSVTGHVDIMASPFGIPALDKYSFAAIRHTDGSVSGQFEFEHRFTVNGQQVRDKVHGTVDCLTIIGNSARLGGTIRHSKSPDLPEGTQLTWSVTDNGQGKKDQRDTASEMLGNDAFAYCLGGLPYPQSPLRHGNIQVRP